MGLDINEEEEVEVTAIEYNTGVYDDITGNFLTPHQYSEHADPNTPPQQVTNLSVVEDYEYNAPAIAVYFDLPDNRLKKQ